MNSDRDEQKVSEMIIGLSIIVFFILLRVPIVNFVSLIVASRSINSYSFGLVLLNLWMKCVVIIVDSRISIVGIYLQVVVGVAEIVTIAATFSFIHLAQMEGLMHSNSFLAQRFS